MLGKRIDRSEDCASRERIRRVAFPAKRRDKHGDFSEFLARLLNNFGDDG